jgi:large subunit ribosomal protein L18
VTLVAFNSRVLNNYGFKGGKNLQSAYLSGLASGLMALDKGVKNAILDIGLRSSVKNSRIYACLKGVLDAGVKIPHGKEILPSDELIKKDKLKKVIDDVKMKKVKKPAKKSIKKTKPKKSSKKPSKKSKVSKK